jgi:hypothetical protein
LLLSRQPAEKNGGAKKKKKEKSERPIYVAYKPYFYSQQTVFSYHNKLANNIFSQVNQAECYSGKQLLMH